jgi:hypothetical protein
MSNITMNAFKSNTYRGIVDDRMLANENHPLQAFLELGKATFAMDVDQHRVKGVLAVELQLDPSKTELDFCLPAPNAYNTR